MSSAPFLPLGGHVSGLWGGCADGTPPCTAGCYQLLSPAVAVLCDHRGGRGARHLLRNAKIPGRAGSKVCFATCKTPRSLRSAARRRDEALTRRRGTPVHPNQAAGGAHGQRRDARDALRGHRSHGAPLCRRLPVKGCSQTSHAPPAPSERVLTGSHAQYGSVPCGCT